MRRAFLCLLVTACALAHAVLCARGEEARPQYAFSIAVNESAQALLVNQQLTYTNRTGAPLTYVLFSAYGNCFRRESALPFDNQTLEAAFPQGYAPGGLDMAGVWVNGARADWGAQGENETFLRVACALAPGEACVFSFAYTVLVTENQTFLGATDEGWQLTRFYLSACPYQDGDFVTCALTRAGECMYAECADFQVSVSLPPSYALACGAPAAREDAPDGRSVYAFSLTNARDLGLAVSRKYHAREAQTASGARVRAYGQNRIRLNKIVSNAAYALSLCEEWFGPYPHAQLALAESHLAGDSVSSTGLILLSEAAFADADEMRLEVYAQVARQYFAQVTQANPALQAWLSEAFSEYAALLMAEEKGGSAEFSRLLTKRVLPALQITVPGGLTVNSVTALFQTRAEYRAVVRLRGAAVLHELRAAVGRETLLRALALYLENGRFGFSNARDFANALQAASGRNLDSALLNYLNTIQEYANEILYDYD